MTTVAALATTLFLGGWRAPWPLSLWSGANAGWWPVLWFLIKVYILLFCYIWLRGTLPRVRYDQLMAIGWKILIPVSIVWILLIATVRAWRLDTSNTIPYVVGGVVLVSSSAWSGCGQRRAAAGRPLRGSRVRQCQRGRSGRSHGHGLLPGAAAGPAALSRRRHRQPNLHPGGHRCLSSRPVKGFGVTFHEMFRKVETVEYPEVKKPTAPRFHGHHQLNRWPDGLEKCIGCECAPGPARRTPSTSRAGTTRADARFSPVGRDGTSTRSTTCAASCAACASRRARHAR